MENERRYVYKIAATAEYKGEAELAALRKDLKQVGEIKSYQKIADGWKKTRAELAAAKERAKELHVELKKGGGKDVEKAFAAANREVSRLTNSLDKQKKGMLASTASLKENGVAINNVSAEYKDLEASATSQGKKLAAVNRLQIRTAADIEADIKSRKKAYDDLRKSGVADLNTLARAEESLRKQTKELKDELDVEGIGLLATGVVGGIISIGLAAKAIEGVQFFTGLQDDLLATKALTGANDEEFQKLKAAAYSMADGAAGPAALAAGFAELATSGASVNEILGASGTVKNLTAASRGALDFKSSGDVLTNTLKVFGLELGKADQVGDILVKGWSSAGQEADELGAALVRAGGRFAKTYEHLGKVERLQKATAVISALAEVGYKGSEGATILNGALRQLIKPGKDAAEVLEKYKDTINVIDPDTGKIRDFADIIDDVKAAGLDARESMALFGDEAGKGMPALVAQGGDFIRDFETKIKDADGAAKEATETMGSGLGGATRNTAAQFEILTAKLVDSVTPAIIALANEVSATVKTIASLPTPVLATGVAFMGLASASASAVTAIVVWKTVGPSVVVAIGTLKAGIISLRAAISATVVSMGTLGIASAALAGAWGVVKIGQAVVAYGEMRDAQKMAGESAERAAEQQAKYQDRLERASTAAGKQLSSFHEVQAAYQAGELAYDAATDTYSKGAGKIIAANQQMAVAVKAQTVTVTDDMKALWQQYADKVVSINDQIAGRTQSVADKLREMARGGMSAAAAFNDLHKEAKAATAEAKKLAEAGELDKAIAAADKAAGLYERLNGEIKEGDEVIVSQAESLRISMEGVEQAGNLAIEILEQQKIAAEEAADALNLETSGQLGEYFNEANDGAELLSSQSDEFREKWVEAAKRFGDETVKQAERASAALDKAAEPRTAVITTKTVTGQQLGGPVGVVTGMRSGGAYSRPRDARAGRHFPGFGGGDRWANHVIAENGEFMLRKEGVRSGGIRLAHAHNRGDLVGMAKILVKMPNVQKNILGNISLPAIPRLSPASMVNQGFGGGSLPGIELHDILTDQRAQIFSTPFGLEMITREMARSRRLKSSGV